MESMTPDSKVHLLKYAILKLAEWQCSASNPEGEHKFQTFLSQNNFKKEKVLLLPFFLCSANGKETRELMFHFYNKYKAEKLGYIETEVSAILNSTDNFFEFSSNSLLGIKDLNNDENISVLIEKTKSEHSLGINADSSKFIDYYSLVDHAITVYEKNNWLLYQYLVEELTYTCSRHITWQIYRLLSTLAESNIDIDMLIKEKSVFAKNIEDRIRV